MTIDVKLSSAQMHIVERKMGKLVDSLSKSKEEDLVVGKNIVLSVIKIIEMLDRYQDMCGDSWIELAGTYMPQHGDIKLVNVLNTEDNLFSDSTRNDNRYILSNSAVCDNVAFFNLTHVMLKSEGYGATDTINIVARDVTILTDDDLNDINVDDCTKLSREVIELMNIRIDKNENIPFRDELKSIYSKLVMRAMDETIVEGGMNRSKCVSYIGGGFKHVMSCTFFVDFMGIDRTSLVVVADTLRGQVIYYCSVVILDGETLFNTVTSKTDTMVFNKLDMAETMRVETEEPKKPERSFLDRLLGRNK